MTYDLALVNFPFTSLAGNKKRPCLILCSYQPKNLESHYIIAMITSQINGLRFPGDVLLKKSKEAGLLKPSILRLSKIVTVEKSLIKGKLGRLADVDIKQSKKNFKSLFKEMV